MRNYRILILLILSSIASLLMGCSGFAQESDFYQASQYYKDGQYKKAISTYEHILETGKTSGPLYYNLGNSYFKDDQLGKAVLSYMRAKKIMPRDSDVEFNYKYALSKVKHKFGLKKKGIIERVVTKYADYLNPDELLRIILVNYFLICAIFLWGLFFRWSKKSIFGTGIFLSIFLLLNSFIFIRGLNRRDHMAVAIVDVEAKFEPIEKATVHFNLSEGNTAIILEKQDDWVKIERMDGKVGWIRSHDIESI